jgi:hypothetical protein
MVKLLDEPDKDLKSLAAETIGKIYIEIKKNKRKSN